MTKTNTYPDSLCPRHTPWGAAQNIYPKGPGLYFVSTAGHGGLFLSPERLAHFKTLFPTFGGYAGLPWLEEDVDCVLGTLAFPADFTPEAIFYAVESVTTYKTTYPKRGQKLSEEVYYFAAERDWLLSSAGDDLRKIAADYSASRVGMWRRGGCGSTKFGWETFWRRGTESVTTETKNYITDNWWTDAQVQAHLQKPYPAPAPAAAPKPLPLLPPFNENDCGGVFDGRCVTSDADSGL